MPASTWWSCVRSLPWCGRCSLRPAMPPCCGTCCPPRLSGRPTRRETSRRPSSPLRVVSRASSRASRARSTDRTPAAGCGHCRDRRAPSGGRRRAHEPRPRELGKEFAQVGPERVGKPVGMRRERQGPFACVRWARVHLRGSAERVPEREVGKDLQRGQGEDGGWDVVAERRREPDRGAPTASPRSGSSRCRNCFGTGASPADDTFHSLAVDGGACRPIPW